MPGFDENAGNSSGYQPLETGVGTPPPSGVQSFVSGLTSTIGNIIKGFRSSVADTAATAVKFNEDMAKTIDPLLVLGEEVAKTAELAGYAVNLVDNPAGRGVIGTSRDVMDEVRSMRRSIAESQEEIDTMAKSWRDTDPFQRGRIEYDKGQEVTRRKKARAAAADRKRKAEAKAKAEAERKKQAAAKAKTSRVLKRKGRKVTVQRGGGRRRVP